MVEHYPSIPFERFADDILCHCHSEEQAIALKDALERRFAACGLELHPTKTKIVYCKDDDRRGTYPHEKFDYLGHSFQARRSKNRWGKYFINFSPGVSNVATKAIREEIRNWQLRCRVDKWIDDLARMFNPLFVVGSRTMVVSISRPFIRRFAISTDASRVGRWRNTNASSNIVGVQSIGSAGCPCVTQHSSLTGPC